MDILKLLHREHLELKHLFKILTLTSGREMKERLRTFELLGGALAIHFAAEEEILYERLKEFNGISKTRILKLDEEHHVARVILEELTDIDKDDECWMPKLLVLKDSVERHIEVEECYLFDEIRGNFDSATLLALGKHFERRKAQIVRNTETNTELTVMDALFSSVLRA